ncbi:MAG: type VI secretion system tip protein VgrG [Polyangiaceae bacterium]|jgi:type VI secretion system secreted protein VgrG|nr:type VI secretion system tip protein VgrG [Polyangiaceae bacterium]
MSQRVVGVRLVGPEIDDAVRVQELTGRERISELFDFELVLAAPASAKLDAAAMLGSEATIFFEIDGVVERRLHGMLVEVDDLAESEAPIRRVRVRFAPRLFRTTLVVTQEVFLDRSVPEIVTDKLALLSLDDAVELRLGHDYPKKEFVTQYKESDLAFLSRLLEHEGISFFFEHDEERDADVLVLTDHNGGFRAAARDVLDYRGRGERADVFEARVEHRLRASTYIVQDYNYRKALLDLTADEPIEGGFGGGIVEYGTHHRTPDEGKALAKIRAEEQRAEQLVVALETDRCDLTAGSRVALHGHPTLGELDLLVVEIRHEVRLSAFGSETQVRPYVAHVRATPLDRAFRPPRKTPKPRIFGVVNGLIDDAQRHVDKYSQLDTEGRYIVRLLYDTADASGRLASQWIRMAQPHAGPDYGMHFPLKPGVEVLLAFIDGDPDRPIIVGAVPNPVTPSPVDQRSNTLNRIKSASGVIIEIGDRRLSTKGSIGG